MGREEITAIENLTKSVDGLRSDVKDMHEVVCGKPGDKDDCGLKGIVKECRADRGKIWTVLKVIGGVVMTIIGWIVYGKL